MLTIAAGVAVFTLMVLTLVLMLIVVKSRLAGGDLVHVTINSDPDRLVETASGTTLLTALGDHGIYAPSACGGKGTCGVCKLRVTEGGGVPLPMEAALLSRSEVLNGMRLACQVRVKQALSVEIPEAILGIKSFRCRVTSTRNVSTFIREIVLEPLGEGPMTYEAGAYVQVRVPAHKLAYSEFAIEDEYRSDWDRYDLWKLESSVGDDEDVHRAYSIATAPYEKRGIMLNVRIATPPRDAPTVPTGKASSYIFKLRVGDEVEVSGPYGDFKVQATDREMVFIGGGAGMAPLRSIIFDQLNRVQTDRKISFWYGARSLREAFYVDEFVALEKKHDNFGWHLALSAPLPEDEWQGDLGNIHAVLYDRYLNGHSVPEEVEYYLCGPPLMLEACLQMLDDLGVPPENIRYDEF